MNPTVMTGLGLLDILTGMIEVAPGTAGAFAGAMVAPFTNDVDPGRQAIPGDFTAATFTGGEPKAIGVWGTPYINAAGDLQSIAPLLTFRFVSGVTETVFGVTITKSGGGLLAYARLVQPITFNDTNDVLDLVPRLLTGYAGYGSFELVD